MKMFQVLSALALAAGANTKVNPSCLGLDEAAQYAGYIDVPHGSLFYWVIEARNDPENAPLVIWFNGGPGCSSLSGMLAENGPATIQEDLSLQYNPYSWTEHANILYLDQPVNTGYSTATHNVTTTVEASEDIVEFVKEFYKMYPKYLQHDLHFAGESYAGRYIPVFAEAVMTMENRPKELKSVLLGNAAVDQYSQYGTVYDYLCVVDGGFPSLVDQATCETMNSSVPECIAQLSDCIDNDNADGICNTVVEGGGPCDNAVVGQLVISNKGINVYNLDEPCAPSKAGLCYASDDYVTSYLDQASVKCALGVDPDLVYTECNNDTVVNFYYKFDALHPTQANVTNLLDLGVKFLIYNGDKDPLVNWVGARNWTRELEWSGHEEFAKAIDNPRNFTPNGNNAGQVSNYGNLTFLRVFDAGHMVPHDQPENSLAMFNSWIKDNLALN